jgi:SAM-dependent methyltransferase
LRRTVEDLNRFYASPEGATVRRLIGNKLAEAWPDVRGLDVLGVGYCTPYLDSCVEPRRVLSAMPGGQGAEIWPADARVRSVLVEEEALPFPSALFDRILMMHALEEAPSPQGLLLEASRLLSANGRLIIGVAARGGFWAHAERTPFGYGQPYSRMQLEAALRDAELEPLAWSYALYAPPWSVVRRWAAPLERVLPALWPISGGLILMEAARRPFVARTRTAQKSLLKDIQGALAPVPAPGALPTPTSRELEQT